MDYKKNTLLLIAIATIIRCIIAATIGLGNDEVYYRMYAQYLQWNYFDHPPMVGWLIRFTTGNLTVDNELFIRLSAIISAAITTWLLYLSGKKLQNEYTGFLAAAIYTATLYGSIIAGTFILPDSPQMVCWSAGLYLLIIITANNTIDAENKKLVCWFGVIAGIGMLCKIHTSFLWLGFLLYILFYNRNWFKQPVLYVSGIITLLLFYPVIQWNINNHFVTYLYHSQRVNVTSGGIDITSLLTFTGGQVFYLNPIIFPFLIIATIASFKNKLVILSAHKRLLLLCSVPLILLALIISLFKTVLPHWTGPAYSGIILLTACYFSNRNAANNVVKKIMPTPLILANTLLAIIILGGVLLINFLPGTMGNKEKNFLGEGDFTLDMYGWYGIKSSFERIIKSDIKSGAMKPDAVIISNKWFPAAHIDYYVGMPLHKDIIAIGDTNDIHQYAWINEERKTLQPGDDAYCIVPSTNYFDVRATYAPLFKTVLSHTTIDQKRNGKTCRTIYIFKLKDYLGK